MFEHVYLEDSYVLGIVLRLNLAEIELDVVLRSNHPDYVDPAGGSQYCFRRGVLRFEDVFEVDWRMPDTRPATDASGEVDFGGLDSYSIDGATHRLVGEIGELVLSCGRYELVIHPAR